jgi:purine-binding chemotaxis protein CheW
MNDKDVEDTTLQPPIDADQLILQARAGILASPPATAADTEYIEVVTFALAYETYAIETIYIDEVHPLKELTPLPCIPAFVAGIINVRGEVISVIDIKVFFELPAKGLTDLNKVIILSDGVMKFGILADAVLDVKRLPLRELQTSLPTLTGIREDYLRGITADRLVVLDAVGLLSDPKIIVHEEVL